MDNQFNDQFNESNINLDDPETTYYCSPLECDKSTGFNRLQKLILYNDKVNQYDNIKELIKSQPKLINQPNTRGWTPLMIACTNSRKCKTLDIIKLLLDCPGINVNAQQCDGWTALMTAARNSNRYSNIETVELLLKHPDINVNLQMNDGWDSLMLVARHSNMGSCDGALELLLNCPDIDVNHQQHNGWSALMLAVGKAGLDINIQTIRLLLKNNNHNINLRNISGKTVLMICIEHCYGIECEQVARLILSYASDIDIDIDLQDVGHETALDHAIGKNNLNVIKLLCDYGASLAKSRYTIERLKSYGSHDIVTIIESCDVPTKGVVVDG